MERIIKIIPGFILALLIAFISKGLESLLPLGIISGSVIALFIGMAIHYQVKKYKIFSPGLEFTSKRILRFSIILLGGSLSIGTILSVGRTSLLVMFFTLLTCFGGGHFIGKALGLNWKLSNLISAGTGICGGSAIAAIAPVIEADDKDIAYAMSATFIFDMIMILLFPLMGRALGLSDMAFGLWAGTAINDTSSVVAAGYAYSEAAGDFATMVKLTRTLVIIPTVIVFSLIYAYKERDKKQKSGGKISISSLFPWFILGFLLMSLLKSLSILPEGLSLSMKGLSKFLMTSSLAAIGLKTNLGEMKKSGINPMIHGFIISALVVIVAITVEYFMGLV